MGPAVLVPTQSVEDLPNRLAVDLKIGDVYGVDGDGSDGIPCYHLSLRKGVGRIDLAVGWVSRMRWRINFLPDDVGQGSLGDPQV